LQSPAEDHLAQSTFVSMHAEVGATVGAVQKEHVRAH
jgi:hypothetical protein